MTLASTPVTQGIAAALCGGFVSFSLGLVGGGGSILAVPLILYVVGVHNPHIAIGIAALVVSGMLGETPGSTVGKMFDHPMLYHSWQAR